MSATKSERLLNLVILLLVSRNYVSKQRIRESVEDYANSSNDEAFEKMFERDKEELRALGIPIDIGAIDSFFEDELGYRIARDSFELPELDLGPDEVAVLGLAARVWQHAGLAASTSTALLKLRAAGFDVDRAGLLAAAVSFAPLSHRLEEVPSADGRRWVDDSLATAPEAVVAALETYPRERVELLLGGSDRGLSFAPLRAYLTGREGGTVEVIAVGPAGARWVAEGGDATLADDFADALRRLRLGTDADIVLLSPGAPSFDEFASYEERSAAFRAAAAAVWGAGVPIYALDVAPELYS